MTIRRFNLYLHWSSIFEGMMLKTRSVKWTIKRIPKGRFALMSWCPRWHQGRGIYITFCFSDTRE